MNLGQTIKPWLWWVVRSGRPELPLLLSLSSSAIESSVLKTLHIFWSFINSFLLRFLCELCANSLKYRVTACNIQNHLLLLQYWTNPFCWGFWSGPTREQERDRLWEGGGQNRETCHPVKVVVKVWYKLPSVLSLIVNLAAKLDWSFVVNSWWRACGRLEKKTSADQKSTGSPNYDSDSIIIIVSWLPYSTDSYLHIKFALQI